MTPLPAVQTGADLTISAAAAALGITVDTIRYYEKEGIAPAPARGPDGWRRYDEDALAWLAGVVMLRGTGMNVREMKAYATAYRAGSNEEERLALLEEHRTAVEERLAEVGRHLSALDRKIAAYRLAVERDRRVMAERAPGERAASRSARPAAPASPSRVEAAP